MDKDFIHDDSALRSHLDFGEHIIWTGRPKQGIIFKTNDWGMIPFSLLWGGFAVFWEYTALKEGAPFFFALFGVPFVLIGLHMIIGRFFYDSIRRKNTIYGLTNNRIIILSGILSKTIKSIDIKTITNLTVNEKPDGSGTINLGPDIPFSDMYRETGLPGMRSKISPTIEMINDVKKVYRQITELQKESKV
jgi:hypothetical protein